MQHFLDAAGLTYLWKKVSMEDYPNNETLIAILNAIDETKADKTVLDQYLTKEEYIAGESGGTIDLSYFLTEEEADILLRESLINYLTKTEAQNTYATLQQVYPIGAIYLSVNATNPTTLFGFGTWQQIKDTFLLAAGDTYLAGSTGGEERHALTIEEMPSHTHTYQRNQFNSSESGSGSAYGATNKTMDQFTATSNPTGGSIAHNNMPPYLTVYMWQRVG